MKIRTFKYISDQKYFVEIRTEDFSEGDLVLMQKFGEPEINVGGLYGAEDGPTSTWIAPDRYVRVRQGFQPFSAFFDQRNYGTEADDRANALLSTITTRITDAMTVLRAMADEFSSETITNV